MTEQTVGKEPELQITINGERLSTLIRSNISCHMNKNLSQQLIDTLCLQIAESIDYFLNKQD